MSIPKRGDEPIKLSELIEALKSDLVASAKNRPEGWEPLLQVAEAEVELEVTFERDKQVSGGFSVYLAKAGAKGSEKSGVRHRIRLRLTPSGDQVKKMRVSPRTSEMLRGDGAEDR